MSWSPGLDLETLRPGERKRGVGLMKRRVRAAIVRKGVSLKQRAADLALAAAINVRTNSYGSGAKRAVMVFQKRHGLKVDGIVGRSTWLALGFKESDLMPAQLRGIPYPPDGGVRPMDGNWVALPLWNILASARKAGAWLGMVNSGWRPDWYQKILFAAAVRKYGSEAAASKWVARPGTSKHRFKDERGAVDVERPEALLKRGMYRPMTWESWHLQIRLLSGVMRTVLGKGVHPELADPDIDENPDVTIPDGVDIDVVTAFAENELDELETLAAARKRGPVE